MSHPTVTLTNEHGPVEIDAALAPLISALWVRGVTTLQCCQHDDFFNAAVISFPTAADAASFLDAVWPNGEDENDKMQDRIRDWEVVDPARSETSEGWRWETVPEHHERGWDFVVQVQFPVGDIEGVTARVADAQA